MKLKRLENTVGRELKYSYEFLTEVPYNQNLYKPRLTPVFLPGKCYSFFHLYIPKKSDYDKVYYELCHDYKSCHLHKIARKFKLQSYFLKGFLERVFDEEEGDTLNVVKIHSSGKFPEYTDRASKSKYKRRFHK